MTLLLTRAFAASWTVADVDPERGKDPAVVVVTPGVDPAAFDPWVAALHRRGLDVHLATLSPDTGPEEAIHGLHLTLEAKAAELGPLRVAAHGYGGLLTVLSGFEADRLALVAAPLAAQRVPVGAVPGTEGLPWTTELVGEYPPARLHPDLSAAYAAWAAELPSYHVPTCPVFVTSGNLDVVAPPEVVRLPSEAWPERTWERLGFLALEPDRPHMEVLQQDGVTARVARFLGGA